MQNAEREQLRDEVARRVMGWALSDVDWAYSDRTSLWNTGEGIPVMTRYAWRPDENDAQAMQVLDRMTALGFAYTLGMAAGTPFATFEREGETGKQGKKSKSGKRERDAVKAEAENRRVAILRAALAALDDDA